MASTLPNMIVGTGENAGKMYFYNSAENKYSEVVLGEEKNGKSSAMPTGRQLTYDEIQAGQEKVQVQKKPSTVDPALIEAKKTADLIKGVTSALSTLPPQEELLKLVTASRDQMVVGNIAIPALMESLESIYNNLDVSKISQIEEAFGATAVETQKSKMAIYDWKAAKSDLELEIEKLALKKRGLNPESEDYSRQVEELELQEIDLRKEFNSKYPVPPEPEMQVQYLINEKLNGVSGVINAMVTAINKVASAELPNSSRTERKIRRMGKTIVNSYDTMVNMLVDTAATINSKDIDKALGWKESGVDEYVTFTKTAPDGTEYKEYLTRKQYNESRGENEDVKIKNMSYFKPHFAAEESVFRIGEFVSKMVDPIQKVSSIDLSKVKGPMRLRMQSARLANSMSALVKSMVRSFSRIDTEGSKEALSLLMGDQGSEKVIENIQTLSRPESGSSKINHSTEKVIEGKRLSVIDIVSAFLDTCNKIASFDFKPVIKKSIKFQAMTPVLGAAFKGVLNSMYRMIPDKSELDYDTATLKITAMNDYIKLFNEKAMTGITTIKVPSDKIKERMIDLFAARIMVGHIMSSMDKILLKIGSKDEEDGDVLVDPKVAVENFTKKISPVNEALNKVSKIGDSAKEAAKSIIFIDLSRLAIGSVIRLSDMIRERMSEVDDYADTGIINNISEISGIINAMVPAMSGAGEISAQSRRIRRKDLDTSQYALMSFTDTMDYMIDKDVDYSRLDEISNGLSSAIEAMVKLSIMSHLVPADNEWLDTLFDKKDGAMSKFIEAMLNVYAVFKKRKFTPEKADELLANITKLDDSMEGMKLLLIDASDLSKVVEKIDINGLSNGVLGEGGPLFVLITSVSGIHKKMADEGLDTEGIEDTKKSIEQLRTVTRALIGIMLSARLLSAIVSGSKANKNTEKKAENLINVLLTPIKTISENEETIKNSVKPALILAAEILLLVAVVTISGIIIAANMKAVTVGLLALGVMVWASIQIIDYLSEKKDDGSIRNGALAMLMIAGAFIGFSLSILILGLVQDLAIKSMLMFVLMVGMALGVLWLVGKISERGGGTAEMCMPLLIIAGSFLLFSLSILMLGLVQDLAFKSLLGFILLVGLAIGVIWLINKMGAAPFKGALALMVIGAAFLVFSFVLKILAGISEDMDIVGMLALVGVMGALIGIGVLAGFGIIPLVLGSIGIIVFSAALIVFGVALTMLVGIAKLLGNEDIQETINPIMDTLSYMINKLSEFSIGTVLAATANAVLLLVMTVALLGVVAMIQAIKAIAPSPEDVENVKLAMCGVAAALKAITDGLAEIGLGSIIKGLIVSVLALVMLVALSVIALILLGFSRLRIASRFDENNKPVEWESLNGSSFDRVGEMMVGLTAALKDITDGLSEIGLGSIIKGLIVSVLALGMLVPLSVIALILLGFSRMRIATEFDENNKPIAWESLDGSSFDRVGDMMVGMVNAINRTAEEVNKIGIIAITKAMVKAVESLAMIAALAGIMKILSDMGGKRVPVEWDDNNKPTKWATFDDKMIEEAVRVTTVLVSSVDSMAMEMAEYDTDKLKAAKKNAKLMKGIISPISSLLDLIMKLTEGPISFGQVDEDGNPIGNGDQQIKGNLGDYLKTHEKQVTDNIDTLIGIFNLIAQRVSAEDGIGNVNSRTLKRARRNIGRVGEIMNALKPGIDIIQSLTSGSFNIGTEDNPQNVNLGDFLRLKRPEVEQNLTSLFEFVEFVGDKAVAYYQKGEPKDTGVKGFFKRAWSRLKSAVGRDDVSMGAKKIGRVGEVMSALSPAIDLIQSMSNGEYTMKDEKGNEKKVSLGEWIRSNKPMVTSVLDDLFEFVEHVGDRAAAYYLKGQDQDTGAKGWFNRWLDRIRTNAGTDDISMAAKKIGRVGEVMSALNPALDLIIRLSSGEYEIPDPDKEGAVIKTNLARFIRASRPLVQETLNDLFDLVEFIGTEVKERFGWDDSETYSEYLSDSISMTSAISKCKMINESVTPILGIIEVVEKIAGGVIETVDSKGKKMKVNLHTFVKDNMPKVRETIFELLNFMIGEGGLVDSLSVLARMNSGEMSDDEIAKIMKSQGFSAAIDAYRSEKRKKENDKKLIETMLQEVNVYVEGINKIVESTKKLSDDLYSKELEKIFTSDPKKNLKGKMVTLFAGLDLPLDDEMIFAHTQPFSVRLKNLTSYDELLKKMMKVENVENYRKSVDATGDMVKSINSINDTKIDKLNTLMRNMIEFGKTMDEALKEVFDRVVELAEELHYIIEADMKKNNPEEYRRQKQQEQRSANPLSPKNNQPQQPQPANNRGGQLAQQTVDMSAVENRLNEIAGLVAFIKSKM